LSSKAKEKWFAYDTETGTAQKIAKPDLPKPKETGWTKQLSRWGRFRADSVSPDRQTKAFVRNGNIYLGKKDSKDGKQLTYDGNPLKPYGELSWSPDSRYLVCYRIDEREERQVSIIFSSLPNTTRGEVKTRGYAQPGDEFTSYEMYVIDVQSGKPVKVQSEPIDFFNAPVIRWRKGDATHFTYEKVDRGHQRFRVIGVDATNGATQNIIDEKTETFIYQNMIYTHYQPDNHEIIWASEKDGWRHIYLVDEQTGKIKKPGYQRRMGGTRHRQRRHAETRSVVQSQRNECERRPVSHHYYRIKFDGTGLVKLTDHAKATHQLAFSPDRLTISTPTRR
jgi:WD40 repeat protein